tara:strand:+ start:242 stop:508 length:267 start_codon:yes stop_codon:yes gene_type:complete
MLCGSYSPNTRFAYVEVERLVELARAQLPLLEHQVEFAARVVLLGVALDPGPELDDLAPVGLLRVVRERGPLRLPPRRARERVRLELD